MHFLNGITVLLVFQLLGEVTARWLQLPVPGPVVGMIYLFSVLLLYKRIPASLDTAATGLLAHLSLLFIPAGVGLMVYFDDLKKEWLPISVTLVLSTLFTMAVVAWLMQTLMRLFASKTGDKPHEQD